MRERYGLEGVPLVIDFIPKKASQGRPHSADAKRSS